MPHNRLNLRPIAPSAAYGPALFGCALMWSAAACANEAEMPGGIATAPVTVPVTAAVGAEPVAGPVSGTPQPDANNNAGHVVGEMATTSTAAAGDAAGRGQVYTIADFARYAPRNALDMLDNVPGFTIQGGGGNGARGLGQANENVLINGSRLSSKSDSTRDQLSRITAANVVRIEIVDGTTLEIPGLSGQVANIVVQRGGLSGQFTWRGGYRPYNAKPQFYGGEASVSGGIGQLDYTFALANENSRFGADGPSFITDRNGILLERQDRQIDGRFDNPKLSTNLKYDLARNVTARINASYTRPNFRRNAEELIFLSDSAVQNNTVRRRSRGYEYEIGGDLEFPLGAGTLKLIALESFDRNDYTESVVRDFLDQGAIASSGDRFDQIGDEGERIARAEYGWAMWGGDWQVSAEAAFNRLDNTALLYRLDNAGVFQEIPFPAGSGGVSEDRYESTISFSRVLTPKLALQTTLGAEYSKISQTGSAANARTFQRPKGSLSLAWKPEAGLDVTLAMRREVGQLSFGDFLARVFLDDGNANGANNELVPSQAWISSLEINKSLGIWGSSTLSAEQRWIEDFIDLVPLPGGGEARGNIASARRLMVEWNSTFNLDPLGVAGARLEVRAEINESSLRDPLTGETRAFPGRRDRGLDLKFRHDVPGSQWAYGSSLEYGRQTPVFRISEISRETDGPSFLSIFAEHKDVAGLTVTGRIGNLLGGRSRYDRTVFAGPRNISPVLFAERRNLRIGPTFNINVSGNF